MGHRQEANRTGFADASVPITGVKLALKRYDAGTKAAPDDAHPHVRPRGHQGTAWRWSNSIRVPSGSVKKTNEIGAGPFSR